MNLVKCTEIDTLTIVKHPNERLFQKCQPFDYQFTKSNEMIELMLKHKGIGLAANQVGLIERMFVMVTKRWGIIELHNPEIKDISNRRICRPEGCLSINSYRDLIYRPDWITINTSNKGQLVFSGIEAACVEHELEHLDGITIKETDYRKHLYQFRFKIAVNGLLTKEFITYTPTIGDYISPKKLGTFKVVSIDYRYRIVFLSDKE